MKQKAYYRFALRWAGSSVGLWLADGLLGDKRLDVGNRFSTIVLAGLFLALVNMALKPLLVFLSIPALIISLGLFMLVVNGVIILVASWLYSPLHVKNLAVAVVAGIIVGLTNLFISKVAKEI